MTICDNRERLVAISVMGQIHHPTIGHSGTFKLCHDGTSGVLPRVGGITYNVKLGDCVYDKVCDPVEPGISMKNPDPKENDALVMLACIGNKARVVSGDAKGAAGFVTGFHGGIEHTLSLIHIYTGNRNGDRRHSGITDSAEKYCRPDYRRR